MSRVTLSVVREISFEIDAETTDKKVLKGLEFIQSLDEYPEHWLSEEKRECIKAAYDWVYKVEPDGTYLEDTYRLYDISIHQEDIFD